MRTQSRVDAAAFALLREGKNPTVALVRARISGGSPNIVAPALQQWRLTSAIMRSTLRRSSRHPKH